MRNSEINRLGDSLRIAAQNKEALNVEALEEHRLSYWNAAHEVANKLAFNLDFTSRTKSTESIVAKLIRQRTARLSQIQDIVGFRYVVANLQNQADLCSAIQSAFPEVKIKDYRFEPQHGYRAVHLIVTADQRKIEIQVRTHFQHLWAQYSEALADRVGHALKYGGGDERIRRFLEGLGENIRLRELEVQDLRVSLNPQQIHEEFQALLPTSDAL